MEATDNDLEIYKQFDAFESTYHSQIRNMILPLILVTAIFNLTNKIARSRLMYFHVFSLIILGVCAFIAYNASVGFSKKIFSVNTKHPYKKQVQKWVFLPYFILVIVAGLFLLVILQMFKRIVFRRGQQ